ncbi:TonB C-terminal domain-containing protein, partial [Pelagibacteraceae bacterium]|nr:TonB C-terminal domain-containing protein [Pelagibacteraceae bacterium]
ELFDSNNIAALVDKSKIESAETNKKLNKITQDQDRNIENTKLTLGEKDSLTAQIFGCWSVPLGLSLSNDMVVRIKLDLNPDGSIEKMEMLDHIKMNTPGKEEFRILADSVKRAVQLCNPLRVPANGYERWKNMILTFDATEMLAG